MSWRSVPLGALFQRVEERGRPDLPLLSVYRDFGVVPRKGRTDNHNKASDDLSSYKVVREGDLVLNKMKTWQGSLGVSDHEGIVSPAYFIGRPRSQFDRRFLHHLLRSGPMIAQYGARSKGIRPSQWDLPWDEFKSIRVSLPPLTEQRAIADYLDAETARIDALIAKKQQLIQLLEERANAEIMAIVGRSELAGHAEIETRPIRRLCVRKQAWTQHGEMITAFRDGQVTTRSLRGRDGFTNSWTEGSRVQVVSRGDVVVHGLDGFAGAIGESEADGVCSPVYHVIDSQDGDSAFLGRMLRLLAINGYLSNFATSTRERAVDFRNWELFGSIPIPDVGLEVQNRVGQRIRAIRPLRTLVEASEKLALEKRQALITHAVAGDSKLGVKQ